jgi:hypothetical protein
MSEKKLNTPPPAPERKTLDQPDPSKRYSENPPERGRSNPPPPPTTQPKRT